MDTYKNFHIMDGVVTARLRRPIPLLMLHISDMAESAFFLDVLMKAGGQLLNPSDLKKLPRANRFVKITLGSRVVNIAVDKQDGTCWSYAWDFPKGVDLPWRQKCYDTGGVLLTFTSGPDPEYLKSIGQKTVHLGTVMTASAITEFHE